MFVNLILLLIIIFLLFVLSMVWPPDSPWAPWWRTSKKIARVMCRLAKVNKNDVVYDLGSGDGTALITAAKEFGAHGVGIEIDPLRAFVSTLLLDCNRVRERVIIKRKNFFNEDLSKATVVFAYLVPKTLARLKQKFLKELRPGTRIITFKYEIDLPKIAEDKRFNLYVYKI